MKKKSIFALAFVLTTLLFTACSDDNLPDGGGSKIDPEGKSWLALRISPTITSRAPHTTPENAKENATADETKVNSVKVILFDGFNDNSKVTDIVDLASGDLDLNANNTFQGNSSEAFEVSNKSKSLLIIVNPNSKIPNISVGVHDYAYVNKAVEGAAVGDVIGSSKNSFMMTNAKGGLEPSLTSDDAIKALTFTNKPAGNTPWEALDGDLTDYMEPTKEEAKESAPTIKVDRVAAKVRLYNSYTYSAPSAPEKDSDITLKVSEEGWKLNVTNKKYYPVSKRTYTAYESLYLTNNSDSRTAFWTNKKVWSDQYAIGSYRVDPNYIHSEGDYPEGDYNFYTSISSWNNLSSATGVITNPEDPSSNVKTNVEYCLENTQQGADNVHGYTTHALFKARVIPSHFKQTGTTTYIANPAAASDYEGNDYGWIKIGNAYFSFETLTDWVKAELNAKYVNLSINSSSTTPTPITDAYLGYLDAVLSIEVELAQSWDDFVDETSLEGDEEEEAIKSAVTSYIATKFVSGSSEITKADFKAGADANNIFTYYADGMNYYKIMIKHDNYDSDNFVNKLGEFGVVRNSVYDIVITGFNSPGYPELPEIDTETPDEEDKLYLSVKIEINPWTWYRQTEIL